MAIVTSNIKLAAARGNLLLPREASGLPKDSVINVSQIVTLDKTFLVQGVGSLPVYLQEQVDEGLRKILYL